MDVIDSPAARMSADDLVQQIDRDGYAVVENFVSPGDLKRAQTFVADSIAANGGEYVGFSGASSLRETFLAGLAGDPAFIDLCRTVFESGTGRPAPDTEFYTILRCLSGASAKQHSMRFHYDSYVLTTLIPITIPDHGLAGRLILHPNTRRIRASYLVNLLDKVLVDNRLTQFLLSLAHRRGSDKLVKLPLKPGSLYLFWGYRTLHTNEPCEVDAIRATALLHYADPHAGSSMKRVLRRS